MTFILGNKKEDAFRSYMKQMQFCDINFEVETKEFATANTMLSLHYVVPGYLLYGLGSFQKTSTSQRGPWSG